MRFVVDAQLPEALVEHLQQLGHDAIHVKHLPRGGEASDSEITAFADAEDRVVVTKDSDFRHTHETGGHPFTRGVSRIADPRATLRLGLG